MKTSALRCLAAAALACACAGAFAQSKMGSWGSPDAVSASDPFKNAPTGPVDSDEGKKVTFKDISQLDLLKFSALPDSIYAEWNKALASGGYPAVEKAIEKIPNDPKLILWLKTALDNGHFYLGWIYANRLSEGDPEKALQAFYLANLGLEQEMAVCSDARNWARISLAEKHSNILRIARANMALSAENLLYAIKILSAKRAAPLPDPAKLLCAQFKETRVQYQPNPYAPAEYEAVRVKKRNEMRAKYKITGSAPEAELPLRPRY